MADKLTFDRQAAMERVELVRQTTGLSKRRFAMSIGILGPQNYSACLAGRQFLTPDQLYTLWQTYGADPAFIFTGREDGISVALLQKLRALDATS